MSVDNEYIVQSVVNALEVLSAFRSPGESLRLKEIVGRTGFNRCMCFRLLYTLHHCGYLEKVEPNRYRLCASRPCARRFRIGFSYSGQDSGFAQEVLAGLLRAARSEPLDITAAESGWSAKAAVRNAGQLVAENVDLVMQFQADPTPGDAAAARYQSAHIPVVAIDVPQAGAIYFGVNHYEAGLAAGRHLGRWAAARWADTIDELVLLELATCSSIGRSRSRGLLAGLDETLHLGDLLPGITIDGAGQYGSSLESVRRWLRGTRAKRVLVAAGNDSSALGALRAFEEAGRSGDCAIVGQNAEPEARTELRAPRTGFIGSVAGSPEQYGEGLVRLALDMLARKPVPQASFVKHRMVTRENVDRLYPDDHFLDPAAAFAPASSPVAAISNNPRVVRSPCAAPRARRASSH